MLVLSRKQDQWIHIGDNVRIKVQLIKGNNVRIGIEAPKEVKVLRGELEPYSNEIVLETERPKEVDKSGAKSVRAKAPSTHQLNPASPLGDFIRRNKTKC